MHFPNNMNTSNQFPTSMYPPSGFNDNNFNRTRFPSNVFPVSGGITGNPTGRFNPITTNTQYDIKAQTSNFNEAFEQPYPIIERMDYINMNNVLHNNIGNNVLDETIVEYRIILDSQDRNIKYYPDPFSYVVKFNTNGPQYVHYKEDDHVNACKGIKMHETRFSGEPSPIINKYFRNIKYVKLENVVLPQHSRLRKNKEGEYEFDPDSLLISDRYVSLVIDELTDDRIFSTSDNITRIDRKGHCYTPPTPFALIFPDKLLGFKFYTGTPYYGGRIYKSSDLGNINQLTIQFCNSEGEPLKFNDLYTYDDLQEYECEHNKPFPRDSLRNPYNKRLQNNISLIIGVVESQVNTNTKFEL